MSIVKEFSRDEINLITDVESTLDVLNVNEELVWAQVPCAVDSGACANVAPKGIFKFHVNGDGKLAPKFFAADGSPIENLGALAAEGFSDDGHAIKIDFTLPMSPDPCYRCSR